MQDYSLLIFITDDDEDDRLIFSEAIEEISPDIELVQLKDGSKLLAQLNSAEKLPDIIFLDLNMPIMNGKETLKAIRADQRFKKIPVVIYSTSVNPSDIKETFETGGSRYLEKPYTMCGMVEKLKNIIFSDWSAISKEPKEYFISSKETNPIRS